jgi:Tol biopolymer transport system component
VRPRRANGAPGTSPRGLPINTFANEYRPWLGADGASLWFASDRFGSGDVFRVDASLLGVTRTADP